uniref:Centrosomal protein POC5 n=1 Tax=Malurus cyaneus samueli TaxID=2593467 RepID=A0A8C5TX48_9PASS
MILYLYNSLQQDEYEELFRYTVVTPKFEQCVSKLPEPASEKTPADKDSDITDDASLHKIPGSMPKVSPSVKQASMEQPYKQVLPEATSLHGSREVSRTPVTELVAPDETLTQIENILDLWSGSLKTNILTELKNWKLSLIQHHKFQMRQEKEKHIAHVKQLQNEIENLKELLHTYEISISRKDEVITTLTKSLDKQKERVALMRNFAIWRIQHVKAKQEEYANRIADRHFQTALMKKVWTAWRSLTQAKWKEKVARACQLRAEDVCVQLTNDYEAKIAELVANLEQSKTEILRLHNDRDEYEDTMKKAFMRGVCALNLEAMTMFQCKDSRPDPGYDNAPSGAGRPQYNPPSPPPPPAPAAALQVEGMPMAKVITSAQQKPARTITARITGRVDMGPRSRATGSLAAMGIPPPVSSVIVEKHHPITQQTISQATAAKYPRTVLHSSGSTTVRPAGQVGRVLQGQTHTSVQSIKVVD